jgi:hypothetical protein
VSEVQIVVDTTIFFSLLLHGETARRKRFLAANVSAFHAPRFVFVELFKHKERIAQASKLRENEFLHSGHDIQAAQLLSCSGRVPHSARRAIHSRDKPGKRRGKQPRPANKLAAQREKFALQARFTLGIKPCHYSVSLASIWRVISSRCERTKAQALARSLARSVG